MKFFIKILKPIILLIPDKVYLQLQYRKHLKANLNLKNPRTFNEKIQWLKIHYRKPEYSNLVDKLTVREHIKKKIGEEYLIPLEGVYNSVDEIEWSNLPNKFVLKCTHGSHCNIICTNKSELDINESNRKLEKWMKQSWYWYGREWPYKNIIPRIICEKFLIEDNKDNGSLTDYKFFCFNGIPKFCQVIRDRNSNQTIDFYDSNWNHMEFTGLQKKSKKSSVPQLKPNKYDEMLRLAETLSEGHPFVRVDLYYVEDRIYFGELTFYPLSGLGEFNPSEWNEKIGELIQLP